MRIDPLLLPILAAYDPGDGSDITADRANGASAAHAMVGRLTTPVPASVTIEAIVIPCDPPVPARRYTPAGPGVRGGLVFAHGGGWATGSSETANEHCGTLAADADVIVISLDYRLVPEHPFPAGLDDVTNAVAWITEHARTFGIDPSRLAIGGESAGANLAAVAVRQVADRIALQLLEVPALDLTGTPTPSRLEVQRSFPALHDNTAIGIARYLKAGADPHDPSVSPLLASDLAGLPPALLLAADVDPWRDDAVDYAQRLTEAGVPTRLRVFDGIVHGTEPFTELLPSARQWHTECVGALRSMSIEEVVA
jgi:acetyl esterase